MKPLLTENMFHDKFLWGASTSAQVEGAYLEDGKGLSIADARSFELALAVILSLVRITISVAGRYPVDERTRVEKLSIFD